MRKYKGNYFTEEEIQADQIRRLRRRNSIIILFFLICILGFLVYEYKYAEKGIFNKGDNFEEYDPNYSIEDKSNVSQSSGSNSQSNTKSNGVKSSNVVKPSNPTSAVVKSNTTKSNATKSNTTKSNTTSNKKSNATSASNTVVVNTKSFAEDSWDTISKAVKYGKTSAYKVGDMKTVTIGGKSYRLRIANLSKPSECNNSAYSQTACGLVIEFYDIFTTQPIDSTNECAWSGCNIRTYLNTTLYTQLPEDLKRVILNTKSVTGHGTEGNDNYITSDKLYLLSVKEVFGNSPSYDSANDKSRQLDYYKNHGVTSLSYDVAFKYYKSRSTSWWLRTPSPNASNANAYVDITHKRLFIQKQSSFGIAPAFRVG